MTDDERVTVMQIEEEKDQFSETQETIEKEKKPRKRKTQEEKIEAAQDIVNKKKAELKEAEAELARLLVDPKVKRTSDNHCKITVGDDALILCKKGKEFFTIENLKAIAYKKLNKPLEIEFLDKYFK